MRPSFSALQRAENSSIIARLFADEMRAGFSALQRAENSSIRKSRFCIRSVGCFSALQRAENSSIERRSERAGNCGWFQCSSASRKFLNRDSRGRARARRRVSVLFSEPKIPQSGDSPRVSVTRINVSVLFSEPKIPQCN